MEIKHKEEGQRGKFYVEIDGEELAEMTYAWQGKDRFFIDHTEVSEVLAGKRIGKQLVMKAVEMAREKNVKIVPLCSFAKKVLHSSDEFLDVL